jgi:GNAT superfamily N-acetyltransferase
MGDVAIRSFTSGDLAEVLEVLRVSLGEAPHLPRTPEWFTWKHLDNPFGESILLLAEVAGQVAGVRAFLRWELQMPGGDRLRCVRPVDTATHPDFQRMGIFRALTEAALDVARDDGVDLVFNTPNPRSGAGYRSMGWDEVGEIGVMVRPSLRLLAAPLRGVSSGEDLGELIDAPDAAGEWPNVDPEGSGLRTPRTAEYLSWRFQENPVARYKRIDAGGGTVVLRANLRRGLREVVVSDAWGENPGHALRVAVRASRADYMVGWFPTASAARRAAIRAGMLPVPGVTALHLFARPLVDLPVDVSRIDAWNFTMSDLELL